MIPLIFLDEWWLMYIVFNEIVGKPSDKKDESGSGTGEQPGEWILVYYKI